MTHAAARGRSRCAWQRDARIVSNNFRPGVMEKWGLGYEAVAAINPSVIYLSMPMQGIERARIATISASARPSRRCAAWSTWPDVPGPPTARHRHALSRSRSQSGPCPGRGAGRGDPSRAHGRGPIDRTRPDRIDREHARAVAVGLRRPMASYRETTATAASERCRAACSRARRRIPGARSKSKPTSEWRGLAAALGSPAWMA